MTVHPIDLATFDRSAQRSEGAALLHTAQTAASAAVSRAGWLRDLRLDRRETWQDCVGAAFESLTAAAVDKGRPLAAADAAAAAQRGADDWLSAYRKVARRERGKAQASAANDDGGAAAALEAVAALAAERGAVVAEKRGADHLDRDWLRAVDALPRGLGDALIIGAAGVSAETLAAETDRNVRGVKRGLAAVRKRYGTFADLRKRASGQRGRMFWALAAAAERRRASREVWEASDSLAAIWALAETNGYRKPHAASLERSERYADAEAAALAAAAEARGALPYKARRMRKRGAETALAAARKRAAETTAGEWRRLSALRLSEIRGALYGSEGATNHAAAAAVDRPRGARLSVPLASAEILARPLRSRPAVSGSGAVTALRPLDALTIWLRKPAPQSRKRYAPRTQPARSVFTDRAAAYSAARAERLAAAPYVTRQPDGARPVKRWQPADHSASGKAGQPLTAQPLRPLTGRSLTAARKRAAERTDDARAARGLAAERVRKAERKARG